MPTRGGPNLFQKIPVLPSCGSECQSAQSNKAQSKIEWRLRTPDGTGSNFFWQYWKNL